MPATRALVVIGLVLAIASHASAAPSKIRRIAIVVGNDRGATGDATLRYAQRDATRIAQVLRQLGDVRAEDLHLLLERDATAVRDAFAIAAGVAAREPVALVFYYSGHADGEALHLGGSTLRWSELDDLVRKNRAALRIAFADACQSGMLVRPKGLTAAVELAEPRGSAILVATTSVEAALESEALGGSFFTHYLLSGLHGAADADGDLRVTLAELQSYATRQTANATSKWTRGTQHPTYDVDLSGQREVVIADLHSADGRITIDDQIAGELVVVERGSGAIVAELTKARGRVATFALPSGQYRIYVRVDDAVLVGDVALSWGGDRRITRGELARRSYYEVAHKGARLELHRYRIRAGGGLGYSSITGVGTLASASLGVGVKLGPIEWGARFGWFADRADAVDTTIRSSVATAAIVPCFELIQRRSDVRLCGVVELGWWRQAIERTLARQTLVPSLGAEVGVRLPITTRWFAEPSATLLVDLPRLETGVASKPRADLGLAIGALF